MSPGYVYAVTFRKSRNVDNILRTNVCGYISVRPPHRLGAVNNTSQANHPITQSPTNWERRGENRMTLISCIYLHVSVHYVSLITEYHCCSLRDGKFSYPNMNVSAWRGKRCYRFQNTPTEWKWRNKTMSSSFPRWQSCMSLAINITTVRRRTDATWRHSRPDLIWFSHYVKCPVLSDF